jgi:TctA family transporter
MALMLGALIIHGIQPGPMLMNEQPQLFWGLVVSFGIGNVMLVILNLPLVGMWVAILRIPYHVLYPAILVFTALGVYSVSNSTFDIYQVAIVGALGYLLTALRFEAAPLMLGFVLGPLMEEYLRRALLLSHGDLSPLVQRSISAGFLLVCAGMLLWNAWTGLQQMRRETV